MLMRSQSRKRGKLAVLALTVALIVWGGPASAHDGIADQIARLSVQLSNDPRNSMLLLRRAELYRAVRQWKNALGDLDRVSALDPTIEAVDLVRAQVLLGAGQPRGAIKAANRFLLKQPGHVPALIVRGRARVALALTQDAILDFTQALDARPEPDLYIERARVMPKSSVAQIEAVLRGLNAGITRLGSVVTLELEAVELEVRLKRYDRALTRLDRVSARAARKDTWLARRGEILEQAGRLDDARTAYRAALAAAASLPPTRQTRASSALIARLRADLQRLGVDGSDEQRDN